MRRTRKDTQDTAGQCLRARSCTYESMGLAAEPPDIWAPMYASAHGQHSRYQHRTHAHTHTRTHTRYTVSETDLIAEYDEGLGQKPPSRLAIWGAKPGLLGYVRVYDVYTTVQRTGLRWCDVCVHVSKFGRLGRSRGRGGGRNAHAFNSVFVQLSTHEANAHAHAHASTCSIGPAGLTAARRCRRC